MKILLYYDPRSINPDREDGYTEIPIYSQEELDMNMAIIANPKREIPQDSIRVEDAPPPPPKPMEQLRGDVDYIAMMTGVEL